MNFIKDKKVIILAVILFVFTISYFIVINKASYAFVDKYNADDSYKVTISTIKKCAIAYAKENPKLFSNEKTIYIKLQELIDNNFIATNEDGIIINPLNNEAMNSNVIKLKNDDGSIVAEIES